MTTDFGPPVDTHPSGEDRHVDLGNRAAGEVQPVGGAATDRRHALRAWLDTTAWWTEPRPPLAVLVKDAREGEWTLRTWQRHGRWCWVQTAARYGRVWPWLVARQVAEQPPMLRGELPPVRDIADNTEHHWAARFGYAATNWLSWVADGAIRSAVFGACSWLVLNYVNNLPVLRWLVPDVVTAAYWWPGFLHLLRVIAPIAGGVAVLTGSAAAWAWHSRRAWQRRREHAVSVDDRHDDQFDGEGDLT